jgi:hypothetical protein
MPDGVITLFDAKTGEAEVMRGGHRFPAQAHAVEPAARHAGAHVHFDVQRFGETDWAVGVRLRTGTHVSRRQHNFGTLVGARQPDAKGPAAQAGLHPELHNAGIHPLEVGRAWANCLVAGDVDGALALYAPSATLKVGERSFSGRSALQRWLEASPLLASGRQAQIHGDAGETVLTWEARGPEPALVLRCRIAHGEIAEQWVSEPPAPALFLAAPAEQTGAPAVAVFTKGHVDHGDAGLAAAAVQKVIQRLREPVLFARVKVSCEPDPARPRPVVAQAVLDVNGDLVRAQVTSRTVPEAIDALVRRLHDRLEHRARRLEFLHRSDGRAPPGEWRHGDLPTDRRGYFDRPVEERQLVRHKSLAVGELTPDEAIFDMEQLDHDFYLFCDLASGSDAVVERADDGSYRMTRTAWSDVDPGPTAAAVTMSGSAVPQLRLAQAIERLDAGEEPHVFFVDTTTGRGNVVYRRYDGHYGLITPD